VIALVLFVEGSDYPEYEDYRAEDAVMYKGTHLFIF